MAHGDRSQFGIFDHDTGKIGLTGIFVLQGTTAGDFDRTFSEFIDLGVDVADVLLDIIENPLQGLVRPG